MNRDDIIRMAREAGMREGDVGDWTAADATLTYPECVYTENLERFAALVYAEAHKDGLDDFEAVVLPAAIKEEREACARVLDEMAAKDKLSNYYKVAALAIREREDKND